MDGRYHKAAQAAQVAQAVALGQQADTAAGSINRLYAGNNATLASRQSFFEDLTSALTELEMELLESNKSLCDARQRILGAWPENVENSDTPRTGSGEPMPLRDAAIETVRRLTVRARRVADHAYTLNQSL